DREKWPEVWLGRMDVEELQDNPRHQITLLRAWLPYLLLAVLLVLSRLPQLGLGDIFKSLIVQWTDIFNTSISASSTPLYLPGTFLILAGLLVVFLHGMRRSGVRKAVSKSLGITISA